MCEFGRSLATRFPRLAELTAWPNQKREIPSQKLRLFDATAARPSAAPAAPARHRHPLMISPPKWPARRSCRRGCASTRTSARIRPGSGRTTRAGRGVESRRSDRRRQYGHRTARLGEGRQRRPARWHQPDHRAARPRPRRFVEPAADDEPGRAGRATTRTRSRPGFAARRCSRTSSSARRSRTSITSAFRSASSTRAARRRMASSSATKPLTRVHARVDLRRGRQADAGLRPLLDGARRARIDRHGARRARLCREVLHRRGQLGSRRQQHPDLLHPGRDEVPRSGPRREAGAALRDAPGGSAHDTFWDFVSLMPEITHMLMWAMSDRAIPRSYRTMQGSASTRSARQRRGRVALRQVPLVAGGRHAFAGLGRSGEDLRRRSRLPPPRSVGSHRSRRLPEYELGLQIFTEEQAEAFSFDVLDATKIVPEELVPVMPVGRWCSTATPTTSSPRPNRSRSAPRTSCRASTSRTTRCSPAASTRTSTPRSRGSAGRTFTRSRSMRRSRRCTTTSATACIGRRSIAAASRTSRTRSAAAVRSRPARRGSCRFPEPREADDHKVRGKPERFADHYTQATLFWNSQTPVEKTHIINAFRFELSRVQTPAVRERMVSGLMNVAPELARGGGARDSASARCRRRCRKCSQKRRHARGDGVAGAVAVRASGRRQHPHAARRAFSSPTASTATPLRALAERLTAAGAVPRFVGPRLGPVEPAERRCDRRRCHLRSRAVGALRRASCPGRRRGACRRSRPTADRSSS